MAVFEKSYPIIKQNEGGYANDPRDKGGETYAGISRKYNPDWGGWVFIDRIKFENGPIKWNSKFKSLNTLVVGFYIREYWNKLWLKEFKQSLATQIFDYAVNSGRGQAVKDLQRILNRFGFRLKVDGGMGKNTCAAIQSLDNDMLASELLKARKLFIELEIEDQPHYADVWRNRLNYLKKVLTGQSNQLLVGGMVGIALLMFLNS